MEASGHQFERILDQFLDRFLMFFCEAWCVEWRYKNHRFVFVFTVFGGYRLFDKKKTKTSKKCRQDLECFAGGLSASLFHRFWLDFDFHFGSILVSFSIFLAMKFEADF